MKSMCCLCIQFTHENTWERTILHLVKKKYCLVACTAKKASYAPGFREIIFSARKLQECRILHHLPQTPCHKTTSVRWGRVSWPSTRLLNRFEYTSFWGSYVPEHVFFCPRQVVVVYLFICYEEFRRQLIVEAGLLI